MVTFTVPSGPAAVRCYGLSDPGQVRGSNEDRFAVAELARALRFQSGNVPQPDRTVGRHRGHLLVVADGVGGNRAGEVASGLTVRAVETFLLRALRRFSGLGPDDEQGVLLDLRVAVCRADAKVFTEAAGHPEWSEMGTTLTLALVAGWRLFVAHAGVSWCYLLSGGRLRQFTRDHTLTAELARRGVLPAADQARHPWRHVVTNLVGGTDPGVQVELHHLDLCPDDVILLWSDGLTEVVPDEEIAAVLRGEPDPRRACERLVDEANRRGGPDNVTVVVAHIDGPRPASDDWGVPN